MLESIFDYILEKYPTDLSNAISIAISMGALLVSLEALRWNKKVAIVNELFQQKNLINDSIAQHKIKGPYAFLLKIEDCDLDKFSGLIAVYFHQINLLNTIYCNRYNLDSKTMKAYKNWIKNVFAPWINSSDWLKKAWQETKENKDLLGRSFIKWLDSQISNSKKIQKCK